MLEYPYDRSITMKTILTILLLTTNVYAWDDEDSQNLNDINVWNIQNRIDERRYREKMIEIEEERNEILREEQREKNHEEYINTLRRLSDSMDPLKGIRD